MGLSVLGQPQVSYTVDGKAGCDYATAVVMATLKRAAAVESGLSAYADIVKLRNKKLEDLSLALAEVTKALESRDREKPSIDQGLRIDSGAVELLKKYGISTSGIVSFANTHMATVGELQKLQQNVKFAVDTENNNCQQDLATLQGYMDKRDNAFGLASSLSRKLQDTVSSTIRNIG